jgi:hypothetical protein
MGVQPLAGGDSDVSIGHIQTMGLGWVKFSMQWKAVEPAQGNYNWTIWDTILSAMGAGPVPASAWKRPPRHRAMTAMHRIEEMVRRGKV